MLERAGSSPRQLLLANLQAAVAVGQWRVAKYAVLSFELRHLSKIDSVLLANYVKWCAQRGCETRYLWPRVPVTERPGALSAHAAPNGPILLEMSPTLVTMPPRPGHVIIMIICHIT